MSTHPIKLRFCLHLFLIAGVLPACGQGIHGLRQGIIAPSDGLMLGHFDMQTGTWLGEDTLAFAEAFILGSSTFNNTTSEYVFSGVPNGGGPFSWFNYDVEEHALTASPALSGNVHSVHHDMQQNRFFGLRGYVVDSTWVPLGDPAGNEGYWQPDGWATQLVEVQPFSGSVDPLLDLPEVEGVIAGASCFDSDSARFHFLSYGGQGITRVHTLDALGAAPLGSVEVLLEQNEGFAEIEFCIPTGQLVGLWRDLTGASPMRLAFLDPSTGMPEEICTLPQVWGFTPDGSVFDQGTSSYVLNYYDANYTPHLMAIDVVTGTIWADHMLDGSGFLELECSNGVFAALRYGATGVPETGATGLQWTGGRLMNLGMANIRWQWIDLLGRTLASGVLESRGTLLPPSGRGFIRWTDGQRAGAIQVWSAD